MRHDTLREHKTHEITDASPAQTNAPVELQQEVSLPLGDAVLPVFLGVDRAFSDVVQGRNIHMQAEHDLYHQVYPSLVGTEPLLRCLSRL